MGNSYMPNRESYTGPDVESKKVHMKFEEAGVYLVMFPEIVYPR